MATINNTTSLSYPNSIKSLLTKKPSPNCPRLFLKFTSKPFIIRCINNNTNDYSQKDGGGGDPRNSLKDALSGMVGKQVEELLDREENRVLLDGLEKASERVERAKRELLQIEKEEIEAKKLRVYVNQLEARASEIAECQQEILEARSKLEEAESYLSQNIDGNSHENSSGQKGINKDLDRLESIKAASISAIIGTLVSLPVSLAQATTISELILPSAITFISCALYGVTFRYAIRRDLDDFHLKSGTIAAFAFVKGLGMLAGGPPLELTQASLISHAFNGAVYVSENLLIFAFAAVSLDFCFQMALLSPFPVKKTNL